MQEKDDPAEHPRSAPRIPRSLVKAELERILASATFRSATTHRRLLDHLVTRALGGRAATLKESLLGVEVFQRSPSEFDPRSDTIVRVEVRRLRQRLARCYATESHDAQVEISLPVGAYAPVFRRRPTALDGRSPKVENSIQKEARELIERGEFLLRQGDEESYRRALERFEQASALQPDNALSHLGAARAWSALVGMTFEPATPGIEHARRRALLAIQCDPLLGEAHGLLGTIAHRYDFDWTAAEPLFDRAIALAPGSSFLHHALAFSLTLVRRFDEAEAEFLLAHELDAMNPSLRTREALLHLYRHDWSKAERSLRAVLDMTPGAALPLSLLGSVQLYRGESDAALETYAAVARSTPQLSIGHVGMAQALAMGGRRDEALAMLAALQQKFDGGAGGKHLSPYQLAMIYWRLGEVELTLNHLDDAARTRDCNFFCLAVDPAFDALRDHPRFEALTKLFVGLA